MHNDRLSIILPARTEVVLGETKVVASHMQIKRNDAVKEYELRFFKGEKQVAKSSYHNMTINVMSGDNEMLSMLFAESSKKSNLELLFRKGSDVLSIKKYVDTLLI